MAKAGAPNTVTFHPTDSVSEETPQKVAVEATDSTFARDAGGRYERKHVLGQGGMGTVILVRDRTVGRNVALKQLNEDAGDEESLRRFAREARVQGQLEHPAIVPVYDVGSGADGKAFFTMKRVRGESLAAVLEQMAAGKETGFSRRKLLSAFSQLCAAAQYAHERGVVHRDIKPMNVMLGAYGEVYLLDWGVAKVAGEAVRRQPSDERIDVSERDLSVRDVDAKVGVHTGHGAVMGTLTTMAPEQAVGGEVDARTDVYALGAVLFHILTGETFHPRGEFEEVVQKITRGVEARASVRTPDVEVPPELEALIVKATRLEPGDRLASAKLLRDAVEAYLDGDRDLELRRESGKKHADAARLAADRVLGVQPATPLSQIDEEAARSSALNEVGKALALDPENKEALGTLVNLLTSPPKFLPREIANEHARSLVRNVRRAGIAGAIVYGYISLNGFSTWRLGVHDVQSFAIAHVLWGLAFVTSMIAIWRPSYLWLYVTFAFGITNSAFLTTIYSPYLLVSTFITMHAVLFSFVKERTPRLAILAAACIAWTVSVFGERWGLFEHTVRFVDGGIMLKSPVIDFPATPTTLYLYAHILGTIIAPALVVGMLRTAQNRAEVAMRLQAWQLRQLVPDATAEPSRSGPIGFTAPRP